MNRKIAELLRVRSPLLPALMVLTLLTAACGPTQETAPVSDAWVMIGGDGQPLAAGDAQAHHCVFDSRTGLMWEVERADSVLHAPGQTFSWYSSERQQAMSEPGLRDGGDCVHLSCDTEARAEAVNDVGLCGVNDWRIPSRNELMSLGDRRLMEATGLIIDTRFFPEAHGGEYWSAETFRLYPLSAWAVDMRHGLDRADLKAEAKAVRLVRRHAEAAEE